MRREIFYKKKNHKEVKFEGRLVGIINDEEARAILNTKNAPRAVFTSASLDPHVGYSKVVGKRLVLASTTLRKNQRVIIITPEISFTSMRFNGNGKSSICFHTVNHEEYRIIVRTV